jgi:hypothetical protein
MEFFEAIESDARIDMNGDRYENKINFRYIFIHLIQINHEPDATIFQFATVVTDQSWKIQPTQRHTVTGGCMCRIRRLLMMGARVFETCRAE